MKVVVTAASLDDLDSIASYIARDNPDRAVTFVAELLRSCKEVGRSPKAFALVPRHEASGVRRRVHGRYLIFYRIASEQVEVLHVLHGAQDYEHILFPED
jgi:toxin ParE1/3/4